MTNYGKKLQLTVLTAIVATLVACGGGGGEDPAPTPVAPSASEPATLPEPASTTPPTSTYAADSAQKVMFDRLNQLRIDGGFGALRQDASLDQAAKAHADYVSTHFYPNGVQDPSIKDPDADGVPHAHRETPGKTGFTGVTVLDRVTAAGYTAGATSWAASEVLGPVSGSSRSEEPDKTQCLQTMLNTVFHRASVLNSSMQHIGIGLGPLLTMSNGFLRRVCVMNLGRKSAMVAPAVRWSGVYPVDGQTALPLTMESEYPDPAPLVSVKGYPVSLQTAFGQSLTVSSFTLKDGNGVAVDTVLLTREVTTRLRPHEAYLVPVGALRAGTTYTATFIGTSNGTDVNRTWSFTTGQ